MRSLKVLVTVMIMLMMVTSVNALVTDNIDYLDKNNQFFPSLQSEVIIGDKTIPAGTTVFANSANSYKNLLNDAVKKEDRHPCVDVKDTTFEWDVIPRTPTFIMPTIIGFDKTPRGIAVGAYYGALAIKFPDVKQDTIYTIGSKASCVRNGVPKTQTDLFNVKVVVATDKILPKSVECSFNGQTSCKDSVTVQRCGEQSDGSLVLDDVFNCRADKTCTDNDRSAKCIFIPRDEPDPDPDPSDDREPRICPSVLVFAEVDGECVGVDPCDRGGFGSIEACELSLSEEDPDFDDTPACDIQCSSTDRLNINSCSCESLSLCETTSCSDNQICEEREGTSVCVDQGVEETCEGIVVNNECRENISQNLLIGGLFMVVLVGAGAVFLVTKQQNKGGK